jgi:quercetin dioxygenase-like cupin family protein/uncharacterized protein (DUF2249 family)
MGMNEKPLIEPGAAAVISLADETRFAANGIVSRTLLRMENARTVLFGFAEGQELTEHTSTQHALIQVLSGECEFSLAGRARALKAGDFLYMPPGLPHAVRATKSFSMLLTLTKPTTTEKLGAFLLKEKAVEVSPETKIYDGRGIPCSVKHGQIIQKWLDLVPGEHFVLVNDHDPAKLREQFSARWPQAFAWEYVMREPEEFRVKITKLKPVTDVPAMESACSCEH